MNLLSGLLVLDLADEKASFCAKLLADTGARVIKIEKPGGDISRQEGPFQGNKPHPEKSLSFWYNNTSKLGITLNLDKRVGRDIFLKLTSRADVMIETLSPGYLQEIGLNYEVLSMREIEGGAELELELGEFPAVEALAFAVLEGKRLGSSRGLTLKEIHALQRKYGLIQ